MALLPSGLSLRRSLRLFASNCVSRAPGTREPGREGSNLAQLRNAYSLV